VVKKGEKFCKQNQTPGRGEGELIGTQLCVGEDKPGGKKEMRVVTLGFSLWGGNESTPRGKGEGGNPFPDQGKKKRHAVPCGAAPKTSMGR